MVLPVMWDQIFLLLGVMMKTCKTCLVSKPLHQFNKSGGGRYRPECRDCRMTERRVEPLYPDDRDGERYCANCLQWKPFSDFYKNPRRDRHISMHRRQCKECIKAVRNEQRLNNVYGITGQQKDSMLAEQDGSCAICRGPFSARGPNIDHCHESGAVRGILCTNCNTALGGFKDDPELLRSAIAYLEKNARRKGVG